MIKYIYHLSGKAAASYFEVLMMKNILIPVHTSMYPKYIKMCVVTRDIVDNPPHPYLPKDYPNLIILVRTSHMYLYMFEHTMMRKFFNSEQDVHCI